MFFLYSLQLIFVSVNKRVAGVCFGQKKNTHIDIEQCFEFGYNSDENIITVGGFYNTDLEFLGIYSSGSIPDDSDVCILQKLSKALRSSLFLIKFKYSETINEVSVGLNIWPKHLNALGIIQTI